MVEHDAAPGRLDRCQITGSSDLHLIIDLGSQPACNALLTAATLDRPEPRYPLRLWHCPESGLAQLDYVVDGAVIYYPDYPYRSGLSTPLVAYQRTLAEDIVRKCGLSTDTFCVDVGSNDGTLLSHFKHLGLRTLGIEPTNIASIARTECGIETVQSFFTESVARDIARDYGRARLVTMTNVFAHMAGLGEAMRALCELLDDEGVFVTESHYLLDVLEKGQFDTVYHEHIRTYSVKSLVTLCPYYGLEVFDVERGSRYGGNIRAYVARKGKRDVQESVRSLLMCEQAAGLHDPRTWASFRSRVFENRDRFMEFVGRMQHEGRRIAGYSCPGRATPLLNFFGITNGMLPYIGELPGSLKIGKFVPGVHIPIVATERLVREQPDYVVGLAWHYADALADRLRQEGVTARLVTVLPSFHDPSSAPR